ncbi:hypothetical protein BGZ93_001325 [Podila epicladia]|nr:hypothetical protein BGZ92_002496 [Podila epicladia]KAG0098033.1 hypothetical protein BGZ93_001325 [Podila epicladia]
MTSTPFKHNTLKAKRSLKSLFIDPKDTAIPPTPKHVKSSSLDSLTSTSKVASTSTTQCNSTTGSSATIPPYSAFLSDLISSFNAISAPSSTVKTSFKGVDHEAQVNMREKKKVVLALRKASPAQVNEVISLLKAMPDPSTISKTATKSCGSTPTKTTNASAPGYFAATLTKKTVARIHATLKPVEDEDDLSEWNKIQRKRPSERKSNDQTTGVLDEESAKAEADSWWPSVSFTSHLPTNSSTADSTPTKDTKAATQPKPTSAALTTTSEKPSTFWSTLKGKPDMGTPTGTKRIGKTTDRGPSTGEQIALAAATLMAAAAIARPKGTKSDTFPTKKSPTNKTKPAVATVKHAVATKTAQKPPINPTSNVAPSSTFSTVFKGSKKMAIPAEEPSFLVSTINSLTRQLLALHGPPPTHMISAYTFWWGYEIYVPHKCMATIDRGLSTSQVFLGFLTSAIGGIPGLAALVPIAKIISAWVGYQWGVIKTQDTGKGVVISATWVLPVALASRPWDHDGNEDDPPPKPVKGSLKSRLRLIKI